MAIRQTGLENVVGFADTFTCWFITEGWWLFASTCSHKVGALAVLVVDAQVVEDVPEELINVVVVV